MRLLFLCPWPAFSVLLPKEIQGICRIEYIRHVLISEVLGLKNYLIVSLLIIILVLGAASEVVAANADFTDLTGHWSEKAVLLSSSRGIVNGYPDGSFKPDNIITRAETVHFLINALQLSEHRSVLDEVDSPFNDVPGFHWAKSDLLLAREIGLVTGYDDGDFKAAESLTRQELAAMLIRALEFLGDTDKQTLPLNFIDQAGIEPWARNYVAEAVAKGLINGYPDGSLKPLGFTTRAEAAVVAQRFMQYTGTAFDYTGSLKEVNKNLIYLAGPTGAVAFTLSKDALLYNGREQISSDNLAQFQGQRLAVGLNEFGDIVSGEVIEDQTVPSITLGQRRTWVRAIREQTEAGEAATQAEGAMLTEDPLKSLQTNKEVMGVSDFVYDTQADGSGQVIAIIDTGLDAAHPDLQYLSNGKPKVLDWVDFTDEGRVDLSDTLNERYRINGNIVELAGIDSLSGNYRYGFFNEEAAALDVNFNGSFEDTFMVLAADTQTAGVYDTVFVDTDSDGDLGEEKGLKIYSDSHDYSNFFSKKEGYSFSFLVSQLAPDGTYLKLGFDANGHGTHVAGIAAGNGSFQGVAPEANLLVIKAVDYKGEVDWDNVRHAVVYAAENGADVINLSLGYYQDMTGGNSLLSQTINLLADQYNVVFTAASGNEGPGLGSMAIPGNTEKVISAGAYISPDMWATDFQWQVNQGSLWYFSSAGPRKDGLLLPTVVAPGSAVASIPLWSGKKYMLLEGSSMASPHVAGALALLMDGAERNGMEPNQETLRQAIVQGAKAISHLSLVEAGNGLIDLPGAWKYLNQSNELASIEATTYNELFNQGKGLYAREFLPGQLSYEVTNNGNELSKLIWTSTADWMEPVFKETAIPAHATRKVPVKYSISKKEGLYTGLLIGDDPTTVGEDVRLLNTVINPYNIDGPEPIEITDSLEAGQYRRYFVRIPENTNSLNAEVRVSKIAGQFQGRVRLHLIRPNGEEIAMTEYVGNSPEGGSNEVQVKIREEDPLPGVWEMVVYSSATLDLYGLDNSTYFLKLGLDVSPKSSPNQLDSKYVIGVVRGMSANGPTAFQHISVRDFNTKQEFEGFLEVNGKLYEVIDGGLLFQSMGNTINIKF